MNEKQSRRRVGEVFREFRKRLDMKIDDVIRGHCARKTLNNFEKGTHTLNVETFFGLLGEIGVSFEDFGACLRDYEPTMSEKEQFIREVHKLYYEKNLPKLYRLLNTKREECLVKIDEKACLLMLAELIHRLDPSFTVSKESIQEIADYFFSIECWAYYELCLFSAIAHLLPVKLVCFITRELMVKKEIYDFEKKKLVLELLIRVSYSCICEEHLEEAKFFIDHVSLKLSTYEFRDCVVGRTATQYMQGFYELAIGKKEDGMKKMLEAINIFLVIGEKGRAVEYQEYYKKALFSLKDEE